MMENDCSYSGQMQGLEIRVSATLRIFGIIKDISEIARTLNIDPTHVHRNGDIRSAGAKAYEHDMWSLTAPVPREEPLERHLLWLKEHLSPHRAYIRNLADSCTVDIFCGYRTDSDQGGFELSPDALSVFSDLGIRMCVSVIIV